MTLGDAVRYLTAYLLAGIAVALLFGGLLADPARPGSLSWPIRIALTAALLAFALALTAAT